MNNQILLSKRLSEIASFVEPGLVLADIGTDHGFLPISLVQSGQTPEAYACDVRKGPLEQAQKNVAAAGLTGQIKVLLGDGFGALAPGDAECAVIAGMGGPLICRILEEGKAVAETLSQIVLSPQSEPDTVRHYVYDRGMHIAREKMLVDMDKYYVVLDVRPGAGPMEKACYFRYGRCLIKEKNTVLYEYLEKEADTLSGIREKLYGSGTESALKRLAEIDRIMTENREAAYEMR